MIMSIASTEQMTLVFSGSSESFLLASHIGLFSTLVLCDINFDGSSSALGGLGLS
jgi:hypothetical protein